MSITRNIAIGWMAFFSGFALMAFEILGGRLLVPYFGGSIQVWGALISVLLAGCGAGYAWGGRLADKWRSELALPGFFLAVTILFILTSLLGRAICANLARLDFEPRWGALIASMTLFLLPSLLICATTPFLVKLQVDSSRRVGQGAGTVQALSTFGCVAGTLLTSFFMVRWFGTSTGFAVIAIAPFTCLLESYLIKSKS